jgi:hypothetical protein
METNHSRKPHIGMKLSSSMTSKFRFGLDFMFFIQHCFIWRPSNSTVSEDAGIEQWTVVIWQWQSDALPTLLDLIHTLARSHPKLWLDLIHIRLDPIPNSARSHPHFG